MNNNNTYGNSSFWFDDQWNNEDGIDVITGEALEVKPGKDLIKLAAYQRAIANFVNIVTGQNIPVKFKNNNDGNSYTDGESVTISSNLKEKDFDPAVGLALHEGSHIKLTDFKVLKDLVDGDLFPDEIVDFIMMKYSVDKWVAHNYITKYVKMLLNVIEDRRIDNFIYNSAPGYQGYYHAMYDRYFNSKIVDKGLKSSEKREANWESYSFRIINITNHNRDMKALPGLMRIWKVLDLKNIGRLKNTRDSLDVAYEIFKIVEQYIPAKEDSECKGKCDSGNGSENGNGNDTTCTGITSDDGSIAEGGEAKKGSSNKGGSTQAPELSSSQQRQLAKAIEKQETMLNDDIKKTGLSKKDATILNTLSKSNSYSTQKVAQGVEYNNDWQNRVCKGVNVLIVDNVTTKTIEDDTFDIFLKSNGMNDRDHYSDSKVSEMTNTIDEGFRLGARLGTKLKVRNEVRKLDFNRLPKGRLDKRLLASLGYGSQNVFKTSVFEKFNAANIHVSIDASGSMSGARYHKAMVTAVAIAKAAQMAGNINVQISFRTTCELNRILTPVIIMAYDSRKDNIHKIKSIFPHVCRLGVTPEGLCFEAIQKQILESSNDMDSYFLNLSDGEPWFKQEGTGFEYYGSNAIKHGKGEVNKMRDKGVNVLSYFIDGNKASGSWIRFMEMYGKDSEAIDTTNITQLAKTLNNMFLKK
tara:strand:+ start:84 stop:2165 length:2082 start_codon:yes stop_codon:yes gene_type:complete